MPYALNISLLDGLNIPWPSKSAAYLNIKIEVQKNTVPQSRVTNTQIATPGGLGFLFVVEYMSLMDS